MRACNPVKEAEEAAVEVSSADSLPLFMPARQRVGKQASAAWLLH